MDVIQCNNLSKTYRKLQALNNLSFTIPENTITGLVGRNGAGKTTLLKIIAGFIQKTSGEIRVFSEKPFNNLKVSANMIFVNDNMPLPSFLSLADLLRLASSFYKNWDWNLALGLFEYFQFNETQLYRSLSKGKKSTFNIIIGLAARCPLTIFDEPTTGMDIAVRKDFYRALLKDYITYPRTIILSTHLLNEIEDILEDVLLIDEGEKRLHMSISDLKEFAVGLRGKTELVKEIPGNKEVFFEEKIGKDTTYLVVKNSFDAGILERAKFQGIEILSVASDDLCMYLTGRSKGGIDDVFNRS